jgi:hypothetical protein
MNGRRWPSIAALPANAARRWIDEHEPRDDGHD